MSRVTVVYLGGFGRSGSTLVERMLGAADGWVNVGELVDLARSVAPADELCGCGAPLLAVPDVDAGRRRRLQGLDRGRAGPPGALHRAAARQRHLPGLLGSRRAPSAALVDLRTAYTRIYQAVAEVTGSRVVVDASKGPALGQALAGAPGIDLRMLNVVRDPRAVAWSWSRRVERPHATAGGEQMWRIPAHRSAAQWSALQLEMAAIAGLGGAAPRGCSTRTSSPTRSGPWSPRPPRSASRSPPPTCRRRGRPGRARAQPRALRQPGPLPLRPARAPPRRRLDHRHAHRPTGPS